jgi:hypothetical protein
VFYIRYGVSFTSRPLGRATQPFVAAFEHTSTLVRPDGTAELLSYEYGETADVVGSYDRTHLTSAYMDGATIEMNDVDLGTGELTPNGKTVTLGPFTWTATTDIYRFGNDGLLGNLPPDVRNRCQTTVSNTNQKLTAARARD